MQRVFNYGDIQNISITSDKALNILIYLMTSYIIIYKSYVFKMVRFWPIHKNNYYYNCISADIKSSKFSFNYQLLLISFLSLGFTILVYFNFRFILLFVSCTLRVALA